MRAKVRPSRAFTSRLWQIVADSRQSVTADGAYGEAHEAITELCREHRGALLPALEQLCADGHLTWGEYTAEGHQTYLFNTDCTVPHGCKRPVRAISAPVGQVATPRSYTYYNMPDDHTPERYQPQGERFEFTQYPSRMGDALRWPDGRVTDLNGIPKVMEAAAG